MLFSLSLEFANSAKSLRHVKNSVIALSYRVLQNRFTGPNLLYILSAQQSHIHYMLTHSLYNITKQNKSFQHYINGHVGQQRP
ncbi:hypothetical protein HanIR_Chr13g0670381 [Helianthus annuus]|nr:hypothetical protein HanIR_Chr13g0670381 [Helianthus annuus]